MIFSLIDIVAILPELVVAGGACIVLMLDLIVPKGRKHLVAYTSIALILLAAWYSYSFSGLSTTAFAGMFVVDGYAVFFKFVFYIAAVLTIFMSLRYVRDEGINLGEYYVLILFSLSGMMIMSSGADLLTIYLGLELMSLPIYVLVGFLQRSKKSNEAAMKYIVLGAFSSGVLLFGVSLVYGVTGTTNLAAISSVLADPATHTPALGLAMVFLVAGFGFKVAGVPFHMWSPDAYEGAPTPITAFMSTGVKAAAFAGALRVFADSLAPVHDQWMVIIAAVSIASLVVGNTAAIAQTNIKRMLAYSSIGHAGYALLGLITGTAEGVAGVVFYMLAYTFMNIGVFAVIVLMKGGGKTGEEIEDYRGLARKHKGLALVMLILLFSLAGLPPTAGFMGKFYIFMALIHEGMIGLAVIAVIMSAVAAYFYIRIVMLMYMKEPVGEFEFSWSKALVFAVAVTTVAVLVLGVLPGYFIALAEQATFLISGDYGNDYRHKAISSRTRIGRSRGAHHRLRQEAEPARGCELRRRLHKVRYSD